MKVLYKIIIVVLLLINSCSKEEPEFCSTCKVNEIEDNKIELTPGWICYSDDLERFIICTARFNVSYNYCPCEYPEYFDFVENQTVKFEGYKTESLVLKTDFSETTCIRLDTIYVYNE